MRNVDLSRVVSLQQMRGEDAEETTQLHKMHESAISFMHGFGWFKGATESYFGGGVGDVVAVFLLHIDSNKSEVDPWLWVIVGDLPPAYIVVTDNPTPRAALTAYAEEMGRWVDAVLAGKSVNQLIPVNGAPTKDNAEALRSRLDFLTSKISPRLR
jgi:hypothetical protein